VYALLLYGVPLVVVAVTLYVGFLGFRFYLREVVRDAPAPAPED
jgi:hypothetical protein